ncbi:hypothetical protein ABPG75_009446 [Micractinium tetrahymenae]
MTPGELCRSSLGLSFEQALALALAVVSASGLWLWALGRRLPPGRGRLAAAAIVCAINVLLPKLFCRWDDTVTIILTSFNFMWLTSFKAVSWALGRGALCAQRFTPAQFLAVYAAPITPVSAAAEPAPAPSQATASTAADSNGGASGGPSGQPALTPGGSSSAGEARRRRGRLEEDAGGSGRMLGAWLAKAAFIAFLVWLLQHPLPGLLRALAYTLALYALLSMIMDGPASVFIGLTGLRVSPHFDRPWMATSVAAFWSKRWDLAAGNTLRQLVFDCVCEGRLWALPPGSAHKQTSPGRQLLASTATFATSGLVHECIFWYLTGHTTRGVWPSFFLVQVPFIVFERLVLAALKRRNIILPDSLRALATMNLLLPAAYLLFWGPCERYGVADSSVENVKATLLSAAGALGFKVG